jgi:hypothetical protein
MPPVALLCIATWMLAHPYLGIFHDANLYTLQALAHLHPDSLGNDVFLRFGSQDRFTIFSPLYALTIRLFGVDHAAALLTLVSQAALVVAGWRLARTVMPAGQALLGIAVLIAIPGNYGPERIFSCLEPFLTPRMAAEACALAGVAAALSGRKFCSGALLIVAVAMHPVMAVAGIVLLFMAFIALPRPRVAALVSLLTVVCLLTAAYVLPWGEWGRLNADWMALVSQRSPYLFLSYWQLDDWGRASVALSTLIVGSFSLEFAARRLCLSAALTMVTGFALTWLACDLLHLTLVTQMQPWRWEWIAVLTSAVSLPFIGITNWKRGAAGRINVILLLAAWIFGFGAFALITCLTALLSLSFRRLRPRELQLLFWGSCAVLAVSLIWRIASNLEFAEMHFMEASMPLWLRRSVSFAHDGLATTLVIGIAAWIVSTRRAVVGSWICAVLAVAAIGAMWPFSWNEWAQQDSSEQEIARYSTWRNLIAPREDVFWGESPLSTWALLNRPSYISGLQTSGMIFSRESALELERRALGLGQFIGPATFLSWSGAGAHLSLSPDSLRGICRLGVFGYLVTSAEIGMQPVAVLNRLKLYACSPQARAAAAAT